MAFGTLASEFVRTKEVPELDAYRFAAMASATGVTTTSADLSASNTTIAAIDDEYYCDILTSAETDDLYDFFLCKHGYGIRTYLYGAKFNTAEEMLDIVLNNATNYIDLLEEEIDDE